jgi:FxsC-like protein
MIVTFYSFKGGTGRTMALANIAVMLARAQKRVLAVDFDLEAPGLWRFFQDLQPNLDDQPGLLDMLMAQSRAHAGRFEEWRDYVTSVNFEGGSISLMTSGRIDVGYPARVLDFTWNELYQKVNGGAFIEQLRQQWTEVFDFVLIDSRTGITDTGGVCTIALPDLIVPVVVANDQSVEGTLEVLRRAQKARQDFAYDRPPALVLPILSRFDMRTEYEMADQWLNLLSDKFSTYYADWLPSGISARALLEKTKLPYVAYFSFGERLAALREGVSDPESLGYALNSVSRLIETDLSAAADLAMGKGYKPERAPARVGTSLGREPAVKAEGMRGEPEPPEAPWHTEQDKPWRNDDAETLPGTYAVTAMQRDAGMRGHIKSAGVVRPYFFLSYARTPRRDPADKNDPDRWVLKLYRDLCAVILQLTGVGSNEVGFMARDAGNGAEWSTEFVAALATCRVFVPLYSRRYFESDSCGKEWFAFARREVTDKARGGNVAETIVPALWTRIDLDRLPEVARDFQLYFSDLGERYGAEGFYGIMKLQNYRSDYQRAVHRLAQRIIDVGDTSTASGSSMIDDIRLEDYQSLQSTFGPTSLSSLLSFGTPLSIAVLAHDISTLPDNRNPDYYGATPQEWAPYRPEYPQSLTGYVQQLTRRCLDVRSVVTTMEDLRERRSGNGAGPPALVLVDPMLAIDSGYEELLRAINEIEDPWLSVMIPWNSEDPQLADSGNAVREALSDLLGRKLATVPRSCESAASGIGTLPEFARIFPQMATIMTKRFRKDAPALPISRPVAPPGQQGVRHLSG